jgi:hypothetical protein
LGTSPYELETQLDFTAPVIIIGPGRSGTTMLGAALGEHSDFYMIGETRFLIQRLWATFCEQKDYVNYRRLSCLAQQTRSEWSNLPWYTFATEVIGHEHDGTLGERFAELEAAEQSRVIQEIGASFARLLIPPSLRRRRWGMQEIWIGSDSFPYPWDLYRIAFPNALYLHSVRNPFTYLASNFNVNRELATEERAEYELRQWLKMTRHARKLVDTSRYMEFRYEDFIGDGGRTAERIFEFCGLKLEERCRRALSIRCLPSNGPNSFAERAEDFLTSIPELEDEMTMLGYLKAAK